VGRFSICVLFIYCLLVHLLFTRWRSVACRRCVGGLFVVTVMVRSPRFRGHITTAATHVTSRCHVPLHNQSQSEEEGWVVGGVGVRPCVDRWMDVHCIDGWVIQKIVRFVSFRFVVFIVLFLYVSHLCIAFSSFFIFIFAHSSASVLRCSLHTFWAEYLYLLFASFKRRRR